MKKVEQILGLAGQPLLVLLAVVAVARATGEGPPATAGLASEGIVGAHDRASHVAGHDLDGPFATSPCIHRHREGVIVPFDGQPGDIRLKAVALTARPRFFSCMVRNFIISATATFTLENSSELPASAYATGFPFTTHALYGDHNAFRSIEISVDGRSVAYKVAIDKSLYEIGEPDRQLYYKGRIINWDIHPLIEEAADMRRLAPFLLEEGFDMMAYWGMDFAPHEQRVVRIAYTSNSNDFSGCCSEVSAPTSGREPYTFYFDLSNTAYWQQPTDVQILLEDTGSAVWSAVPELDLQTASDEESIEYWGDGLLLTEDLAIPAEPAVFRVTPRRWPTAGELEQRFSMAWIDFSPWCTATRISAIESTTGVIVEKVELPLYLSDAAPTAPFSVTIGPDTLPEPAYVDVYGEGMGTYGPLFASLVRLPIRGRTVTGHDLAIRDLGMAGRLAPGQAVTITAVVENEGAFDEDRILASLYANRRYVQNAEYPGLESGQSQQIEMDWRVPSTPVELLEVEIEPIPGEVNRDNNLALLAWDTRIYLPISQAQYPAPDPASPGAASGE